MIQDCPWKQKGLGDLPSLNPFSEKNDDKNGIHVCGCLSW